MIGQERSDLFQTGWVSSLTSCGANAQLQKAMAQAGPDLLEELAHDGGKSFLHAGRWCADERG